MLLISIAKHVVYAYFLAQLHQQASMRKKSYSKINIHARRNKHIWKLMFFLETRVSSSKATWKERRHINQGSCSQEV